MDKLKKTIPDLDTLRQTDKQGKSYAYILAEQDKFPDELLVPEVLKICVNNWSVAVALASSSDKNNKIFKGKISWGWGTTAVAP